MSDATIFSLLQLCPPLRLTVNVILPGDFLGESFQADSLLKAFTLLHIKQPSSFIYFWSGVADYHQHFRS